MIDVDGWRSMVLDRCRARPALLPHVAVEAVRARNYAVRLYLPPEEQALCEVFALAHDIGKVDGLRTTGTDFHPLDGAAFALARCEPRLAALIAHHSGARHEAALHGLTIPYPYEDSIITVAPYPRPREKERETRWMPPDSRKLLEGLDGAMLGPTTPPGTTKRAGPCFCGSDTGVETVPLGSRGLTGYWRIVFD